MIKIIQTNYSSYHVHVFSSKSGSFRIFFRCSIMGVYCLNHKFMHNACNYMYDKRSGGAVFASQAEGWVFESQPRHT